MRLKAYRHWLRTLPLVLTATMLAGLVGPLPVHCQPKKSKTANLEGKMMEISMPACLKALMASSDFADGELGEGPDLKPSFVAFREAAGMVPSLATQQLQYVIDHGTPAGRLYAAVLLSQKKVLPDKQCYEKLLGDTSSVTYLSGCRGTTSTVGDIARSLMETGKYLNFKPPVYCTAPLPEPIPPATKAAASEDQNVLRGRVYHINHDDFHQTECVCKVAPTDTSTHGKTFVSRFPVAQIKAIETPFDEVTLPSATILHCILEGTFASKANHSKDQTLPIRVWLVDGNCIKLDLVQDKADYQIIGAHIAWGTLSVPKYTLNPKTSSIRPGMTRAEVEKHLVADGGISVPFKYERFVVTDGRSMSNAGVTKFNLAFKPAGMSDVVYYLGKWVVSKQDPKDVVMRISPPYIETPFYD